MIGRIGAALAALRGENPAPAPPPPVVSQVSPAAPAAARWWANRGVLAALAVLLFVGAGSALYLLKFRSAPQAAARNIRPAALGTGAGYRPQPAAAPAPTTPAATAAAPSPPAPPPKKPVKLSAEAIGQAPGKVGRTATGTRSGAATDPSDKEGPGTTGAMEDALRVGRPGPIEPRLVKSPHLMLREGQAIGCVMQTATDNGAGGLVSGECLVIDEVWSREGTVRLINKNAPVIIKGERQMANGQARILLTAATVTTRIAGQQYDLDLMSAVGDSLGRTGVEGELYTDRWGQIVDAITVGIAGEAASATGQALVEAGGGAGGTRTAAQVASIGTRQQQYRTRLPPRFRLRESEVVVIRLNQGARFDRQLQLSMVR